MIRARCVSALNSLALETLTWILLLYDAADVQYIQWKNCCYKQFKPTDSKYITFFIGVSLFHHLTCRHLRKALIVGEKLYSQLNEAKLNIKTLNKKVCSTHVLFLFIKGDKYRLFVLRSCKANPVESQNKKIFEKSIIGSFHSPLSQLTTSRTSTSPMGIQSHTCIWLNMCLHNVTDGSDYDVDQFPVALEDDLIGRGRP